MTRVRKLAAVSLMTPMAAAAIAAGLSPSADAAQACPPLANATIAAPQGTVRVGSSVHVSAQINGLMLLQAHLQISGPGLDKQVGNSVMTGPISGDVVVPKAGYFTLAVIGNGTKCTYQTAGFSVKERASKADPTHSSAPGRTPRPGSGHSGSSGGGTVSLPGGTAGGGTASGNDYAVNPLTGSSPFSLPSVAPDGSSQGFAYPTPEPQVASPQSQPVARNVSETTPVKWGQSLAIALVLLVISAHLGMWSRRQRLATEGAGSTSGGAGKRAARKNARESAMTMTATATAPTASADPAIRDADPTSSRADGASGEASTGRPFGHGTSPATESGTGTGEPAATDAGSTTDGDTTANDPDASSDGTKSSNGRGYHGRRRRR